MSASVGFQLILYPNVIYVHDVIPSSSFPASPAQCVHPRTGDALQRQFRSIVVIADQHPLKNLFEVGKTFIAYPALIVLSAVRQSSGQIKCFPTKFTVIVITIFIKLNPF
jgi:hypothetical protein